MTFHRRAIRAPEEEMRRAREAERLLRAVVARLGNVQVQKVDPLLILLLEPVHDGRHGAAAQSARVEELHELRLVGATEQSDIA